MLADELHHLALCAWKKLSATLYIAPCCSLQHEVNITCNLICLCCYIYTQKNQIDILYLDMIAKDELYNWTSSNTRRSLLPKQ